MTHFPRSPHLLKKKIIQKKKRNERGEENAEIENGRLEEFETEGQRRLIF